MSPARLHPADSKPGARAGGRFVFLNKMSSFRKTRRLLTSSRIHRARSLKEADGRRERVAEEERQPSDREDRGSGRPCPGHREASGTVGEPGHLSPGLRCHGRESKVTDCPEGDRRAPGQHPEPRTPARDRENAFLLLLLPPFLLSSSLNSRTFYLK